MSHDKASSPGPVPKQCCGGHHHSIPDSNTNKPFTDPVYGMKVAVNPEKKVVHEGADYYFCGMKCIEKFRADPGCYLHSEEKTEVPANKNAIYTCPMHPEFEQVGPGSCPLCGMALEPLLATAEDDTSELDDMRRLFYALWPDDATRDALTDIQQRIAGRRVRRENLHLTLAFLGQQRADLLPALEDMLMSLPVETMPLSIDRIGYFPRNRIAWSGMSKPSGALMRLHENLTRKLLERGIVFDSSSRFKPHVTLARDADAPEDFDFEPITWHAGHVALVESGQDARGVVYRVLALRRAA